MEVNVAKVPSSKAHRVEKMTNMKADSAQPAIISKLLNLDMFKA